LKNMASVITETLHIIQEKSPTPLQEVFIDDLVIGIFFTGLKLSTGNAGVAFTPIGEIPEAVCCPTTAARMPQTGNLEGRPVSEILEYSADANVLKSAIGVSTSVLECCFCPQIWSYQTVWILEDHLLPAFIFKGPIPLFFTKTHGRSQIWMYLIAHFIHHPGSLSSGITSVTETKLS